MSLTETTSDTYTIADIGKVFDCLAADFDMFSQSTGLRARADVIDTCEDIKEMAKHGFLTAVNLYLRDANLVIIRATKYEILTDGVLQATKRPGNSMWPRTPNGRLCVFVEYSNLWWKLSDTDKHGFNKRLRSTWGVLNLDTSFPSLTRYHDRNYVSNGYGVSKTAFK